ncbi:MAG: LysR family transcriptional regulator [Pseudomonadota bacterium]
MARLNYHHLYYFWQVARHGNLSETAVNLHVSQSALSSQIKQLEEATGTELFSRRGRKLVLTEAGRRALGYADDIFRRGEELESLLTQGMDLGPDRLSIGVLSTMSRNFVELFIQPLLSRLGIRYSLEALGQTNLLNALANHRLDLVLTNVEVAASEERFWQTRLLAHQPVAIVGPAGNPRRQFPEDYANSRWVLPLADSPIRSGFDGFCAQHQFVPDVVAEANDMAMLRLLARDTGALAVIPEVVVRDEVDSGSLVRHMTLPRVFENFYAVTVQRQRANRLLDELLNPERWQ